MRMHRALSLALAAAALVAGCLESPANDDRTSPTPDQMGVGRGAGGGGSVLNLAPTVASFLASPAEALNDGAGAFLFNLTVFDANAEMTLGRLVLRGSGAIDVVSTRAVTAVDVATVAEPFAFGADGWKVWTGASPRDGVLHAAFRVAVPRYANIGLTTWTLEVADLAGALADAPPTATTVRPYERLLVSDVPMLGDGTPDIGSSWGGWTASPGARNVTAGNYLKIVNVGALDGVRVVVDFSDASFAGAFDDSFTIPVDGNVRFAYFEDTTPHITYPDEGRFTPLPVSPYGTAVLPFTGSGNVLYVTYTILSLPPVLPAQPYTAAFTVTEA